MQNLILLHGALGAKSQLQELKKKLNSTFKVFTLDFEGHGSTPSHNSFSLDLFADNLLQFMANEKVSKTAVFGYSMGGYVALKASLLQPHSFSSIITLGTKFNWSPEIAQKESSYLNADKIEQKIPHYAQYLKTLHGEQNWRSVLDKTADLMQGLGKGNGISDHSFKAISNKVFLGLGDQDKMVTKEETQRIQELIPSAEIYELKNTPHPIDKVDVELLAHQITMLLR